MLYNVIFVLVALVIIFMVQRLSAKLSARRILDNAKVINSSKLEYAEVDPADLPWVDHTFIQKNTEKMAADGFEHLVDYENLTVAKQFPNMRIFSRVFTGDNGTIIGLIIHTKISGLVALLKPAQKNIKTIVLRTEFEDGTFLDTNNSAGLNMLNPFPGVTLNRMDPGTSFETILSTHRASLQDICSKQNKSPKRLLSKDAVMDLLDRIRELNNEYRRKVGYIKREEFNNISHVRKQVVDEFERLRDKEQDDTGDINVR